MCKFSKIEKTTYWWQHKFRPFNFKAKSFQFQSKKFNFQPTESILLSRKERTFKANLTLVSCKNDHISATVIKKKVLHFPSFKVYLFQILHLYN